MIISKAKTYNSNSIFLETRISNLAAKKLYEKYGFKSIKSIVKIEFTKRRPKTTWEISNSREYGFYANVNPDVDHPRWSQARERRIGEWSKRPTLPFNGYADQVASLYSGMDLKRSY